MHQNKYIQYKILTKNNSKLTFSLLKQLNNKKP